MGMGMAGGLAGGFAGVEGMAWVLGVAWMRERESGCFGVVTRVD